LFGGYLVEESIYEAWVRFQIGFGCGCGCGTRQSLKK